MNANFGMNLIRLRNLKGLDINVVSEILKIDAATWQNLEFSLAEPTLEQIEVIAKFFGTAPSDLFMPYVAQPTYSNLANGSCSSVLDGAPVAIAVNPPARKFNKKLTIWSLAISALALLFLFVPYIANYSVVTYCLAINNPETDVYLVLLFLVEFWFIASHIVSLCIKKQAESYHRWTKASRITSFVCCIVAFFLYIMCATPTNSAVDVGDFYTLLMFTYIAQMVLNIVLFAKRKTR